MAAVDIENVKKRYGDVEVIHGLDLAIDDGAFVVLLGPSGCGKSTLLRMIAGLEKISAGKIRIGGTIVNDVHPKDRNIAMVFQNYALYAHMNVRDNMSFSLKLKGSSMAEIEDKVRWAAEILNLTDYLKRYPRQLSGGQRQRVAMGRALVRDPAVFLFDEPLSNLDAKLRVQMRTEIKALQQRLGTTTVFVTHDQIEAMTLAERIVVMQGGRIEQVGAPLDVYDRPANLFVAGFIGSPAMNLIETRAVAENGHPALPSPGGHRLPLPDGVGSVPGQRLLYGVRPEHLRLTRDDDGLPFEVDLVEPTGPDIQVYGRLENLPACAVFTERHPFKPGQRLRLKPDPTKAMLFDAESGRAL